MRRDSRCNVCASVVFGRAVVGGAAAAVGARCCVRLHFVASGRVESAVPFGTWLFGDVNPMLKQLGYFRLSLRDKELGERERWMEVPNGHGNDGKTTVKSGL